MGRGVFGILTGKGRDRPVIHDRLSQLGEYGFRPRAVDGEFRHDLVFILRSQLLMGNQPYQDLGGDVFVLRASSVLNPCVRVISQGQYGVDELLLLLGKLRVVGGGPILLLIICGDSQFQAVSGFRRAGTGIGDPQHGVFLAGVPAEWGGQAAAQSVVPALNVDHGHRAGEIRSAGADRQHSDTEQDRQQ